MTPDDPADAALVARADKLLSRRDFANFDVLDVPAYHHVPTDFTPRSMEQEFFERTVNAAWLAHLDGKGTSAPAIVATDPELPLEKVRELIVLPRFLQAAEDRGIPAADLNHLSTEMIAALRIIADPSLSLNTRQRIKKLGIDWNVYQGWLDYPPFRRRHRELMRRSLDVAVEVGDRVLAERIEAGDLKAIEYANEMTGKFVKNSQQQVSFVGVLSMVLSVLQRRITDPRILGDITDDLNRLMSGVGIDAPLELEATVVDPDDTV